MIDTQTFTAGLLLTSVITSLATEAVKKVMTEYNKPCRANTIAGTVSTIVSTAVGVAYTIVTKGTFDAQTIVGIITLIALSWIGAMVGYDKVMQTFNQFKMEGKDD